MRGQGTGAGSQGAGDRRQGADAHAAAGASAQPPCGTVHEKLTQRRQDAEAVRRTQQSLAPFAPLREASRVIFRTGGSAGGGRRAAIVRRLIVYGLLGAGSLVFLLPLIFMISSSLKPDYQIFDFPPRLIPNPAAWQNYPQALTYAP